MYPVAADQITIRDAEYTVNSTLTNPQSLTQTTVPTMVKVRYADVGYKTDLEKPLVNQTTLPTMIEVRHADVSYLSGIEKPLVEQTTLPTMIEVRHADLSYRTGLEELAVNQTTLPTMIKVRHADVIFKSDLSDGFDLSSLPRDQESTGPTPGKTPGNAEILELSHTTGTVEPWSEVAAVVVISNIGTTARSFWVGLSYKKQGTSTWINIPPQQSVDLYPGGSANVQFSWTLTDEAGTYDIFTKIWDGYDASTDQMILPSYAERTDTGAFIIADRPRNQIFMGTSAEDFDDTLNFPSAQGDTVTVYYNPLANTLSISLYAQIDVPRSEGIIDAGSLFLAIPEELDINYEKVRISLIEHATGDPQVVTDNIISMSLDESSSAFAQSVNRGEIGEDVVNGVLGIMITGYSYASIILTIFGIDITPPPESIDIPDDSKVEDANNYDKLEVSYCDPDKFDEKDAQEIFVLIPLEGNYEGKSIAMYGGYRIRFSEYNEIIQFYKEDIVLR